MNIERLTTRIRESSLFSSLGTQIDDPLIVQIASWEEWPGPEEPRVEAIGTRQQSLHDDVVLNADEEEEWNRALRLVVEIAANVVPYKEGEDAWYAPNIAVWSAAWTFALEELCLSHSSPVPAEISAQLYWYERGHWPCALVTDSKAGGFRDYVVF